MTMNNLIKLPIAAVIACTLTACGSTNTQPEQNQQSQWVELGKAENGYTKPGAPVELAYRRFSLSSANQEQLIELQLTPLSELTSMRVRYNGLDGARLVGVDEYSAGQLPSGEALPLSVRVVSSNQAGGSLAIYIDTESAGFKSSRAFAIRLNDKVRPKQVPNVETGEDGKKYTTHNL